MNSTGIQLTRESTCSPVKGATLLEDRNGTCIPFLDIVEWQYFFNNKQHYASQYCHTCKAWPCKAVSDPKNANLEAHALPLLVPGDEYDMVFLDDMHANGVGATPICRDEGHLRTDRRHRMLAAEFHSGPLAFEFSATLDPTRKCLVRVDRNALMKMGIVPWLNILRPKVYEDGQELTGRPKDRHNVDAIAATVHDIVNAPDYGMRARRELHGFPAQALVVVQWVSTARMLFQRLEKPCKEKYGFTVSLILGTDTQEEKDRQLQQFKDGHIDMLITVQLCQQGMHAPNLKYVFYFSTVKAALADKHFPQIPGRLRGISMADLRKCMRNGTMSKAQARYLYDNDFSYVD